MAASSSLRLAKPQRLASTFRNSHTCNLDYSQTSSGQREKKIVDRSSLPPHIRTQGKNPSATIRNYETEHGKKTRAKSGVESDLHQKEKASSERRNSNLTPTVPIWRGRWRVDADLATATKAATRERSRAADTAGEGRARLEEGSLVADCRR
ncbi:hypothetical protein V9T40_012593 [Parthenolecanium corni]|uniref:Uncharacterized protein n=1 Tax=Parthenolecanium corni TaxID=536013 RepID=A0AAN9T7I8_9HEMI